MAGHPHNIRPPRLLFVCLGNICRSPLAEGVFRHHLASAGIEADIDSAGTASYHVGHAPDPRAIEVAKSGGFDIAQLKARQLVAHDFEHFDEIYVMDEENLDIVTSRAPAQHRHKPKLVLSLLEEPHRGATIVPDPYYGSLDDFKSVLMLLTHAADGWVSRTVSPD